MTQYTEREIRAAVDAAENWGTYVTVHAYTPRAVRTAIAAGVRCIEHGQLLDEETVALMAEKGIWWCLQPFLDDEDAPSLAGAEPGEVPPDGRGHRQRLPARDQAPGAGGLAPTRSSTPGWRHARARSSPKLTRWYSPAEVLQQATSGNAELLALSGPRNPYPGRLGVVAEGALADLLLVDGDPLADISLIARPQETFLAIIKDGQLVNSTAA